jgi:hypothetical protein
MSPATRIVSVLALVLGASFNGAVHADVVKMSGSGLCHPPESRWYERTTNYTAYASIERCLDADGRLPSGMMHIPAQPERPFRTNVNTDSGPM